MSPVMQYENFRAYIQDFYSEHRDRFGFTWRQFAKAAGYSSPVFLKLVSEGKSNLSEAGIERTASAMGLVGGDLLYFRCLVNFNQQKKAAVKKEFYDEMRSIASKSRVSLVGEDQYEYFSSWRNPVLRELADSLSDLNPADYASLFIEKTTPDQVKKSLKTLVKTGLVKQTASKSYKKKTPALTTGNLDVASLTVREMHRQMGELAIKSLDQVDPKDRD
ncbi:MAG TPA: TIGR02147 family protein, partial [Fibrobacter sp.]|nr:TIGR02147 family protein [Fibrobacter sp.]